MVAVPVAQESMLTPVDPTTEVIAAPPTGTLRYAATELARQLRALPVPGDDLQRDFGIGVYDQIGLDPHVSAAERILLTAALNSLVQYTIATPRADPAYDKAARLQAFVAGALDRLPCALESLLYEMGTSARRHGHALAEAVWTTAKVLPNYGPQQIYADIKPRPLGSYAFVQDFYANTLGITPRVAGAGIPYYWLESGQQVAGGLGTLIGGSIAGQPIYPWAKFPTLTWDGRHRDPRGHSAYRPIYAAWWKGQQTEPGLLAYLARFGQPSVELTMPPNAPPLSPDDSGNMVATKTLYLKAGQDWQAGGVYVQPNGASGRLVEATGEGAAYINAKRHWDGEKWVGLTGQTLATNEGQHRSGTDARTHQDMLRLLVMYIKFWLSDWINRWLIAPLIRVNFGDGALALAPKADLGRVSPEDLAALLQAFAQLAGPGNYWNPNVVPPDIGAKLDAQAGMPQRQTTAIGPDGTPTDAPVVPQPPPAPQPGPQAPTPPPQGGPA